MEAAATPTATATPPEPAEPGSDPQAGSQGAPESGEQPPESGDGERDQDGRYLSRKEATYRKRAREAEQERDTLRQQVDELQRQQVETIAGRLGMAVPGDLWAVGTDLVQLRGDDGRIDQEAAEAHVRDLLASRPTWRAITHARLGIGEGGAAATRQKPGLSQLLKSGSQ